MEFHANVSGVKIGGSAGLARPLERISLAVDRIRTAEANVDAFVSRFHGPTPRGVGEDHPCSPGYGSQLEDLFSAIDALEQRISALESIG